MSRRRDVGRFLRALYTEVRVERVTFMAGSIAYHAFISLLPFLLVLLLLLSEVGDPETASQVVAAIGAYFSPNASGLLTEVVEGARQQTSLSILGVLTLLWGALKIFRSLDTAFSDIYETGTENTLADTFADAAVVLLALVVGLLVVGLASTQLSFGDGAVGTTLARAVAVLALSLVFLPVFYVFPDEDVTVREVVPGTVFAALGWTTLESLFRYYVAFTGTSETFGVVGTILLIVTWLYFNGLVLLVGAASNAVLAGRSEDVAAIGWGEAELVEQVEFAGPLEEICEALDDDEDVTVTVGETTVTLPPADERDCGVEQIDRPDLLGGDEARGRLVLRWEGER